MALTDGCALYGSILKEEVPPSGSARLEHNKKYAPAAFEDDSPRRDAAYAAVARNFVRSPEPMGTPMARPGPLAEPQGTSLCDDRTVRTEGCLRILEGETG